MPKKQQPVKEKKKFTSGGIAAGLVVVVIWIAVSAVSRFAGEQLGSTVANEVSNSQLRNPVNIQQLADQAKSEMNLPLMVDEVTRLDNIVGNGSSIRYEYTLINVDPSQIDSSVIKETITNNACTNTKTRNIIDRGVGLEYAYSVENQANIINFTVTKPDCV